MDLLCFSQNVRTRLHTDAGNAAESLKSLCHWQFVRRRSLGTPGIAPWSTRLSSQVPAAHRKISLNWVKS